MSRDIGNGVLTSVIIQFSPISCRTMEDVDRNTDRIIEFMDRACTGYPGLDIVIFPECCFQGYCPNYWMDVGLKWDSEPIRRVAEKCKELGIWGCFDPWIVPDDGNFIENTCILIDDEGEIVHKYVKMNPYIPWEPTRPGTEMPVTQGPKGARFATLICADSNYQEIWREAAYKGANVIIHPSHWQAPYEYAWKLSNLAGAYFNGVTVLAPNSVGMDETFVYCGNSMVVDASGRIVAEAPVTGEWMIRHDFSPLGSDASAIQACGTNKIWDSMHRGASCPGMGGEGLGYENYSIYNLKK